MTIQRFEDEDALAAALATRVLDAIKNAGGTAQSVDIEKIVGGTAQQRRAALHRLIASRKLARTGKARSTTYTVR